MKQPMLEVKAWLEKGKHVIFKWKYFTVHIGNVEHPRTSVIIIVF